VDRNGHVLHVGDVVRVYGSGKGGGHGKKAVIFHFYTDVINGLRLDRKVAGFRSWNGSDVEWYSSPKLLADALLR
jgi:hypothetical protein